MSEYDLQELIIEKVAEHDLRLSQLEDKQILTTVVPASTHLERIHHRVENNMVEH